MPGRKSYDVQESYILDSIDNSGYSGEPLPFIEDKLKFLLETFMSEYGWRVKQVGVHKALTDWLSGLPSSCNIEFRNHLILELGKKWGLLVYQPDGRHAAARNERMEYNFLKTWFSRMAMRIITLWRKHKIA